MRYWPDRQIFLTDAQLSLADLQARARQTSFLVPGLALQVTDARDRRGHRRRRSCTRAGSPSSASSWRPTSRSPTCVRLQGQDRFTETVPMLDDDGHMTPTDVERDLDIDIAVRWGDRLRDHARVVRQHHRHPQGRHPRRRLRAGPDQGRSARALEGTRLLKAGEEVVKDDVLEGMTAVVTVRLAEPQFEGQTKEVLGTPAVAELVAKVVEPRADRLPHLDQGRHARRRPGRSMEKVVGASRARVAARQHREAQRRKNALESSSLPAKLADCRSTDVDRTELFIVEGDSAMGTAKLARNSEFQALLPIRGKILNVQKASIGDMLKNAECASIIQVVGAGSGRTFELDAARYGKIIFMADADSDGAHIRCLLATLFFRYMRPMVDAGRVFTAVPPLHRFELTNPRKGQEKYIYTYSDAEYQRKAAELTKRGLNFKEPQRYKGLGEMDADQLAETTMGPRHRTLRRMTVDDGLIAETTFEMLMGNDVGPRKTFIVDGAYAWTRPPSTPEAADLHARA